MSDSLNPLAPAPDNPEVTLESLAEAHQALRTAFQVTLVLLLILTGSLFVFFLREVSLARRQITDLTQVVSDYEKNSVPLMEDFRVKLQVFAKTHPDFNPIYLKYFASTNSAPLTQSGTRAQPLTTNRNPARMPPSQGR
jgi:hypothetical protein